MRDVEEAPDFEVLDATAETEIDEELPARARPAPRWRWLVAIGVVAIAVGALIVRGALDRPAAKQTRAQRALDANSFTLLGPGGVYTEVPYVPDTSAGPDDAGRLRNCAAGATCVVQRTLPPATLAGLRAVFPGLHIESAWTVVVRRPAPARPRLETRAVYGIAGSRSIEIEIRAAVPTDDALRYHRAGVEGTRSIWSSVTGGYLVQASAFERYESTGGVLDRLGLLVRGATLMVVR